MSKFWLFLESQNLENFLENRKKKENNFLANHQNFILFNYLTKSKFWFFFPNILKFGLTLLEISNFCIISWKSQNNK